jgi:hypothetical protein
LAEVILSEVAESLFWVAATSIPLLSFSSIYPNDRYSTTQRISGYILVHIILQSDAYHECRKKIKKHPNRACRAKKKSKERVDRSAAYVIDCTYPFVVTG